MYGSLVGLKVLDLLLGTLQLGDIIDDTCRFSSCGPDLAKSGFKGKKYPVEELGVGVMVGDAQLRDLLG